MTRCLFAWVGKERGKEPEAALCSLYLERINLYLKAEERVVKPCVGGSADTVRQKEGEKLAALLEPRDYLILLDERGKTLSSPGLAELIQGRRDQGDPRLVFLVGGAMGLCPSLRQRADFMLSLSKMTLPHALARVVIMEQVYRAMCIAHSHPYHHEG